MGTPAAAVEWEKGRIGEVGDDGAIDTDSEPLFIGFPAFGDWSLTPDARGRRLLLEGRIISTNTGLEMQGVRVFAQYGNENPRLMAVSDAGGRIRMRLSSTQSRLDGPPAGLRRLFIGDPSTPRSFTRIYEVTDAG